MEGDLLGAGKKDFLAEVVGGIGLAGEENLELGSFGHFCCGVFVGWVWVGEERGVWGLGVWGNDEVEVEILGWLIE